MKHPSRTPRHVLCGLFGVLLATLAACGGKDAPSAARWDHVAARPDGAWVRALVRDGERTRITLSDGTDVALPVRPRRIVSTLPGVTELVAYLGGPEMLVGVSEWCNFPPEVVALPKVVVWPVNVEALKALQPDLIVCDGVLQAASLPLLRQHFPAVLPLESQSLPHLMTTIDVLGQVLGTSTSRERALSLGRRVEAAEGAAIEAARGAARTPPLRVLFVAQSDPLNVLGPGSLLDDLLRASGAVNVAADLGRASGPFSVEVVIERRPDVILMAGDVLSDNLRTRWAHVPALVEGRVADASADDLVRAGPRTPEALARLAAVLAGTRPAADLTAPR